MTGVRCAGVAIRAVRRIPIHHLVFGIMISRPFLTYHAEALAVFLADALVTE